MIASCQDQPRSCQMLGFLLETTNRLHADMLQQRCFSVHKSDSKGNVRSYENSL